MLEHIRNLANPLEDDKDPNGSSLLATIYIPKDSRAQVIHKLQQWSEPLDSRFSPKVLRANAIRQRKVTKDMQRTAMGRQPRNSKHLEQCQRDFDTFGVIFGDHTFQERREPALVALVDAYRAGRPKSKQALEKHIDEHWKLNPTAVDLDHTPGSSMVKDTLQPPGNSPVLEWDPLHLVGMLLNPLGTYVQGDIAMKGMNYFFEIVAISLMSLSDGLTIEMIAGEMADVLDRLGHQCLEHRLHKSTNIEGVDPTAFPYKYDRIHMSNIPDYVGGTLTSFLIGKPLLRTDRPSNLRFNNLLNPPLFDSSEHFLSEYMLM